MTVAAGKRRHHSQELRLAIDAAALVRKLATAHLHGPWQLPVELIRMALQRGAGSVAVQVRRSGLTTNDSGEPFDRRTLQAVAAALDPRTSPAARHDAAAWLDSSGRSSLLALGLSPWRWARLEGPLGGLDLMPSKPPQALPPSSHDRTSVRVWGPVERGRARDAVRHSCRFTPVAIQLDGRALDGGFTGAVIQGRVEKPLPARLAIPTKVAPSMLWLLMNGVVTTTATVPGVTSFEAAIELAQRVPADAPAGALRAAVRPYAGTLVSQALMLLAQALERPEMMPDGFVEQALLHELVRSLAAGRGDRCLESRLVVPASAGEERARLSIAELRRRAAEGSLECLDPKSDPRMTTGLPAPVPVLGEACRATFGSWWNVAVRLLVAARPGWKDRMVMRLRRPFEALHFAVSGGRTPVGDEELTAVHRQLGAAARAALDELGESVEVTWVRRRRLLRNRHRLLLPYESQELASWLETVARSPEWLHPLVRVVTAGAAERRWRRQWLTAQHSLRRVE